MNNGIKFILYASTFTVLYVMWGNWMGLLEQVH
jgi:hypothetical protein